MYQPRGMTIDELPSTTAATQRVLAVRAANVFVACFLTPFELLGCRDQVNAIQLRVAIEFKVEFRRHRFSESYDDCWTGDGEKQKNTQFSPMITEFNMESLHAAALHQKKYFVDVVGIHLDLRVRSGCNQLSGCVRRWHRRRRCRGNSVR
jgi:hypothetical protein